jgi:hypothetical protein
VAVAACNCAPDRSAEAMHPAPQPVDTNAIGLLPCPTPFVVFEKNRPYSACACVGLPPSPSMHGRSGLVDEREAESLRPPRAARERASVIVDLPGGANGEEKHRTMTVCAWPLHAAENYRLLFSTR